MHLFVFICDVRSSYCVVWCVLVYELYIIIQLCSAVFNIQAAGRIQDVGALGSCFFEDYFIELVANMSS